MSTDQSDFPSGGAAAGVFNGLLVPGFSTSGAYASMAPEFLASTPSFLTLGTYTTTSIGSANVTQEVINIAGNKSYGMSATTPFKLSDSSPLDFNDGKKFATAFRLVIADTATVGRRCGAGFVDRATVGLGTISSIMESAVNGGTFGTRSIIIGVAESDPFIYGLVSNGTTGTFVQIVDRTGAGNAGYDCVINVDPVSDVVDFTVNGVTQTISGSGNIPASGTVGWMAGNDQSILLAAFKPVYNYEL